MDNKLQELLNRDDCYFIHYASNGFYNGSSPEPRISCIIIYNLKTDKGYRFFIKDNLNGNTKEQAEKLALESYKLLFDKYPDVCFIHWNMTANGFGFKAIQARAKELNVELPTIPDENLFDLSSYVSYIAEKKLSIKQILWFNSLLYGDDYLDGKTEAEYFNQRKYDEIYNSVNIKVLGFADVVKLIQENKLKIDAPYTNDDGLTKEERRQQALKISQAREEMLRDMVNHNKQILIRKEQALEEFVENFEPEYEEEHSLFFFDFNHPLISIFANLFANRK